MSLKTGIDVAIQPTSSRWRYWFSVLLGISLGGLFFYLALRKVKITEVNLSLSNADLHWLLPMIVMTLIGFWLRALRWGWVFPPDSRPKFRQAFGAFMIGVLTNNVMPGRLGDFARAGLIGPLVAPIGATGALATIALEKVMDGLILMALLGVAFLLIPLPIWLGQMGVAGAAIFVGTLLVLWMLKRGGWTQRKWPKAAIERLQRGSTRYTLQKLQSRFAGGLNILGDKKHFTMLLVLSLAIWLLDAAIIFVGFQAFKLTLPFVAAIVTGVILCLGTMLPAMPGNIGTYQFFVVTGLGLFAVPESQALALAVFLNIFGLALSTLLGLLAFSTKWVSASRS
jgi:uncharacterized protein (TIRG00374 family)